jgi:hypothetical protein
VRTKGGVSRRRLKTSGKYKLSGLYCAEFGSRSTASGWIKRAMWPLTALGDNNVAGKLNALLKPIQELDDLNDLGKRSIQISKYKQLLEGSLAKQTISIRCFGPRSRIPFPAKTCMPHDYSSIGASDQFLSAHRYCNITLR